ncbi:MAG: hypothetical protein ACREPH_01435 [Rhodanobacteraceae bacterium]
MNDRLFALIPASRSNVLLAHNAVAALVIVMGSVEFLNPDGSIRASVSATTQLAEYPALLPRPRP